MSSKKVRKQITINPEDEEFLQRNEWINLSAIVRDAIHEKRMLVEQETETEAA